MRAHAWHPFPSRRRCVSYLPPLYSLSSHLSSLPSLLSPSHARLHPPHAEQPAPPVEPRPGCARAGSRAPTSPRTRAPYLHQPRPDAASTAPDAADAELPSSLHSPRRPRVKPGRRREPTTTRKQPTGPDCASLSQAPRPSNTLLSRRLFISSVNGA
jgi:hypothetical protein